MKIPFLKAIALIYQQWGCPKSVTAPFAIVYFGKK